MNLSIGRVFDQGTIQQALGTAGVKGADDFLTYMQEFCNQVITALRGRLTFEENSNSLVKEIQLKDQTSLSFTLPDEKKSPKHIIVTRTGDFAHPLTSFAWQITQQGLVEVKASFTGSPTAQIAVTLVIFF